MNIRKSIEKFFILIFMEFLLLNWWIFTWRRMRETEGHNWWRKRIWRERTIMFTSDVWRSCVREKRTMLSNWSWNVDTMKSKVFFKQNKISIYSSVTIIKCLAPLELYKQRIMQVSSYWIISKTVQSIWNSLLAYYPPSLMPGYRGNSIEYDRRNVLISSA